MGKNFTINVADPCNESWSDMTPAERGRHCSACEKVVIDFTLMTDAQLIEYFKRPAGSTCGRFRVDQLGRQIALAPAQKSSPHIKYLAASMLAMEVLTQHVDAAPQPRMDMAVIDERPIDVDTCIGDMINAACVEDTDCTALCIDTIENINPTPISITCSSSTYIYGYTVVMGVCSNEMLKDFEGNLDSIVTPVYSRAKDLPGACIDKQGDSAINKGRPRFPLKGIFSALAVLNRKLKIKRLPQV